MVLVRKKPLELWQFKHHVSHLLWFLTFNTCMLIGCKMNMDTLFDFHVCSRRADTIILMALIGYNLSRIKMFSRSIYWYDYYNSTLRNITWYHNNFPDVLFLLVWLPSLSINEHGIIFVWFCFMLIYCIIWYGMEFGYVFVFTPCLTTLAPSLLLNVFVRCGAVRMSFN